MTGSTAIASPSGRLVHVGRQPILDTRGRLSAYELLFRRDATAEAADVGAGEQEADWATTQTILAAFSGFAASDLLGGYPGFVNLTRAFLVGQLPVPFSPDQAVLEVLETVPIDADVVSGVRRLRESGYRIALDDFVWADPAAGLVELADIVKIDVLDPWDDVLATVERCRATAGPDLILLAERVEDEAMRRRCLEVGFSLFQGFHLGRPQTFSADTLTADRLVAMHLLIRLSKPNVALRDVEQVLRADPGLVLRLLRLANASSNGLNRVIGSITDAVVLLGLNRLRSWMVLLAMSGPDGAATDASPALVRGRTCELLAERQGAGLDPDAAFTVGLLDGIAELLGTDAATLLDGMPPLTPAIQAALRGRDTPLRRLLDAVRHYNQERPPAESQAGPARSELGAAYLAALAWTTRSLAALREEETATAS